MSFKKTLELKNNVIILKILSLFFIIVLFLFNFIIELSLKIIINKVIINILVIKLISNENFFYNKI